MIGKPHSPQASPGDKSDAPIQFGALLMAEGGTQRNGPPYLFQGLTESEIAQVVGSGKRKVLYRGARLFSQGSPQDGIYLIETGRIKVRSEEHTSELQSRQYLVCRLLLEK